MENLHKKGKNIGGHPNAFTSKAISFSISTLLPE